jgi:hypothetical protein
MKYQALTWQAPFCDRYPMLIFPQYRISDRQALDRFRLTQRIGLFPLFVAMVMMYARPTGPGPGLWCVLGLSVGFELLLWGAYSLHLDLNSTSRLCSRLKATSDSWYPPLLFVTQNIFILLTIVVFWLTLRELGGIPSSLWINLNILLLALLIPVYRLAKEMMLRSDDVKHVLWEKASRYLMVILGTTLAMAVWLDFSLPETGPVPPDLMLRILFLGVAASLVILTCIALLLDFWVRRKNSSAVK